jgi:hypothetical protein
MRMYRRTSQKKEEKLKLSVTNYMEEYKKDIRWKKSKEHDREMINSRKSNNRLNIRESECLKCGVYRSGRN